MFLMACQQTPSGHVGAFVSGAWASELVLRWPEVDTVTLMGSVLCPPSAWDPKNGVDPMLTWQTAELQGVWGRAGRHL